MARAFLFMLCCAATTGARAAPTLRAGSDDTKTKPFAPLRGVFAAARRQARKLAFGYMVAPTEDSPTAAPTLEDIVIEGAITVAGLATPATDEQVAVLEAAVAFEAEVDVQDVTTVDIFLVDAADLGRRRLQVEQKCRDQALADADCISQWVFTIKKRITAGKDVDAQRLLDQFKEKITVETFTDDVVRISGELGVAWPAGFATVAIGEFVLFDPTAGPSPACVDSTSWTRNGKAFRDCAWVGARTEKRCQLGQFGAEDEVGTGIPASCACPVSCGTCSETCPEPSAAPTELSVPTSSAPTGSPTRAPTADPSTPPTNPPPTAPPTVQPSSPPTVSFQPTDPTAKPTYATPATMAEKTKCLGGLGVWTGLTDFCGTCCPECTPVVGTSSFNSHFDRLESRRQDANGNSLPPQVWWTPSDATKCTCLDASLSNYQGGIDGFPPVPTGYGGISMQATSDCIRVIGDGNAISAGPNAGSGDAMFVIGDGNNLAGSSADDYLMMDGMGGTMDGRAGNDYLVMDGSGGTMKGGNGDDVCIDLDDNSFYNEGIKFTGYFECETCYGADDVPFDCETGLAYPSAAPTATGAPTLLPTISPAPSISRAPTVANLPLPERMDCLAKKGSYVGIADVCGTCCPACTPVDTSSFTSQFNAPAEVWYSWTPVKANRCVCLDLVASSYMAGGPVGSKGAIRLTEFSDCARIVGDQNKIIGDPGFGDPGFGRGAGDAIYVEGPWNILDGDLGDDFLTAVGDKNDLYGGSGDDQLTIDGADGNMYGRSGYDICTDLTTYNTIDGDCEDTSNSVTRPPTPRPSSWPTPPCGPPVTALPPTATTAEKAACMAGRGDCLTDFCGTCCPACTAVVGTTGDMSSFESHFDLSVSGSGRRAWSLPNDFTGCVCLHLDVNNYKFDAGNNGGITLTPSSDCVRITGSDNFVNGMDGDDAMFADGFDNYINGGNGDDHLTLDGSFNTLKATNGYDVCTDRSAGSNMLYNCEVLLAD